MEAFLFSLGEARATAKKDVKFYITNILPSTTFNMKSRERALEEHENVRQVE